MPEQFTFSDLAFPTMPSSSLVAPHTSVSSFLQNIKRRTARRTPTLDRVLAAIEKAAAEIKADSHGLPPEMYAEYTASAERMLQDLAKTLERLLNGIGAPESKEGEESTQPSVAAEMFVGRVALYLGSTSSFLEDIRGGTELASGELSGTTADNQLLIAEDMFVQEVRRIHAASTTRWREQAVAKAVQKLDSLFDEHLDPVDVRASWQGECTGYTARHVVMLILT